MNSIKTKNNKIKYILLSVGSLVIAGLCFALYSFANQQPDSNDRSNKNSTEKPIGEVDYSKPTADQQNPATDTPAKKAPSLTPKPENILVNITASNQNSSILQIRVLADGLLPQGICELQLSKSGEASIEKQVDTFVSANSTTCKGFDVDVSTIEKGMWNLSVTVSSDGRSGTASREVVIK